MIASCVFYKDYCNYKEGDKIMMVDDDICDSDTGEILFKRESPEAYDYIAIDYDEQGILRASLINEINNLIYSCDDSDLLTLRIEELINDPVACYYGYGDLFDFLWQWELHFVSASIAELEHILKLLQEVRV